MNIQTFSFANQSLQIIIKDNQAWFIAREVANLLGYRDAHNLTRLLDDDEKDTHNMSTPSGNQDVSIINESGFYHAAFKSRKPEVKPFRKWVTSEVLPQIRKTGTYSSKTTADDRTPLRQAVSALVGKKHIDYSDAYTLIHQRFGVAHIDELTHSQIPQAIEYVHRLILDGEVLDKPKNHTVALPEFELVRIAQYLSKTYLSMQLFHELHRALCALSPHFTKRTREEVENNLPLLRGIVHHLQDYSGSLKAPFFNEQFAKSMQFLGRITPQCLAFR